MLFTFEYETPATAGVIHSVGVAENALADTSTAHAGSTYNVGMNRKVKNITPSDFENNGVCTVELIAAETGDVLYSDTLSCVTSNEYGSITLSSSLSATVAFELSSYPIKAYIRFNSKRYLRIEYKYIVANLRENTWNINGTQFFVLGSADEVGIFHLNISEFLHFQNIQSLYSSDTYCEKEVINTAGVFEGYIHLFNLYECTGIEFNLPKNIDYIFEYFRILTFDNEHVSSDDLPKAIGPTSVSATTRDARNVYSYTDVPSSENASTSLVDGITVYTCGPYLYCDFSKVDDGTVQIANTVSFLYKFTGVNLNTHPNAYMGFEVDPTIVNGVRIDGWYNAEVTMTSVVGSYPTRCAGTFCTVTPNFTQDGFSLVTIVFPFETDDVHSYYIGVWQGNWDASPGVSISVSEPIFGDVSLLKDAADRGLLHIDTVTAPSPADASHDRTTVALRDIAASAPMSTTAAPAMSYNPTNVAQGEATSVFDRTASFALTKVASALASTDSGATSIMYAIASHDASATSGQDATRTMIGYITTSAAAASSVGTQLSYTGHTTEQVFSTALSDRTAQIVVTHSATAALTGVEYGSAQYYALVGEVVEALEEVFYAWYGYDNTQPLRSTLFTEIAESYILSGGLRIDVFVAAPQTVLTTRTKRTDVTTVQNSDALFTASDSDII